MKCIKRVRKAQPLTKKKVVEVEIGGWLGRLLNKHNWGAFTLPLPFLVLIIYWTTEGAPDGDVNPLIRVHEFVHVKQNETDPVFLVSWVRYLWESLRHLSWTAIRRDGLSAALLAAYQANAFEAEAYMVEDLAAKNGLPDWAK